LAPDSRRVEVFFGGQRIADSRRNFRVLETASPPTFYLPPEDVDAALLTPAPDRSFCEWKGTARYWRLASLGHSSEVIGWCYPAPHEAFAPIAGYFSFYPGRVRCLVDAEPVLPQPGGFYGGWITREIVGPFKGGPGTDHW
jgi:uncharacterized protein (DUF427 family)